MFDKTVTGITYTLQIKTFICLTTPGKMEKNCTAECQKLLKFYILSEQENNEDSGPLLEKQTADTEMVTHRPQHHSETPEQNESFI